jgi:Arc/MetJ-type ribon-helix-helix transcriptional regulator
MAMRTVQIRITPEQLRNIDEKVKEGKFQSRSEAIRGYIRKAEFFEALLEFRKLTAQAGLTEEEVWSDDKAIRKALYERLFAKSS